MMGRKFKDIAGHRFGRLVAVERIGQDRARGHSVWLCKCDCGSIKAVSVKELEGGKTASCGCLAREKSAERMSARTGDKNSSYRHGAAMHGGKTRLYRIWCGMKARCYNPHIEKFPIYGGRGVTVCPEWLHDFAAFQNWALSHGYQDDLSLDRIDNDKEYSPDNCRWATRYEQTHNRRPSNQWRKKAALPCEPGSNTEESR